MGSTFNDAISKAPRPILCYSLLCYWLALLRQCVRKLTTIGSDNGLLPDRCPPLIVNWTLGNKFQWNSIEILTISFKKMCLKMPPAALLPRLQYITGLGYHSSGFRNVLQLFISVSCGKYFGLFSINWSIKMLQIQTHKTVHFVRYIWTSAKYLQTVKIRLTIKLHRGEFHKY